MELGEKLKESAAFIEKKADGRKPFVLLILGSGLGDMADTLADSVSVDYQSIPHFPVSTVPGHKGRLVIGNTEGRCVMCMQGRFHYYEGYEMSDVVYPVQTAFMMGIKNLFLTNAAGCVNANWNRGDLMIIEDHIKLIAPSPLRGKNPGELGERFFDMTNAYDKDLSRLAAEKAEEMGINIRRGVYMIFPGPSFETPAEVKLARMLGADAVGMSTVPEAIAASHMRMRTLGISCLTNMAAGITGEALNHEEVLECGNASKENFASLVKAIISSWP